MSTTSNENETSSTAKVLLYLDEQKMYSLSSQLFAGFTDYWILQNHEEASQSEEQAGPLGSGKRLSDISQKATVTQERRFLHDWAYAEFERRVIAEQHVHQMGPTRNDSLPADTGGFVKVTGRGGIRDFQILIDFLKKYSDLAESIVFVTKHKEIEEARRQVEEATKSEKDRNKRASMRAQAEGKLDLKRLARETMGAEPAFMEHIVRLAEQWFRGHIEGVVQVSGDNHEYVAVLNEEHLREGRELLERKYGREASLPLTIFGTLIPHSLASEGATAETDWSSFRVGLRQMMAIARGLEEQVMASSTPEMRIDPIAVYTEVPVKKRHKQ